MGMGRESLEWKIDDHRVCPISSRCSFYFVDGKLVMHNKAEYAYIDPDEMA